MLIDQNTTEMQRPSELSNSDVRFPTDMPSTHAIHRQNSVKIKGSQAMFNDSH